MSDNVDASLQSAAPTFANRTGCAALKSAWTREFKPDPDQESIAKGAQAAPLRKVRAAGSWLGSGTMARSTA